MLPIHLRNVLTHTLLFWHFLENLSFECKNILENIRTMFSGNTCLFVETSDLELLKYGSLNSNLSLYSIFMRYDSELFSKVSQFAFYYS